MSDTQVMDEGWETLSDETGILLKWETPGDEIIGIYQGTRHIVPKDDDGNPDEDEAFDQQMFLANENVNGPGDILYGLNGGYKVREALTDDYIGWLVRLLYVKDVPRPGQPSPMKDIKVQARRLGPND